MGAMREAKKNLKRVEGFFGVSNKEKIEGKKGKGRITVYRPMNDKRL